MEITSGDVLRALELDQVVPVFQPIVETRTGGLVGFEVLARWQHAEDGLILPRNFISLVEEYGLINMLTEQVFRKAFRSASLLPAPLYLSVNISPIQLRDLNLPSRIRQLAEEGGFPLKRLTVEITESALMADLEAAGTIARQLKAMGCRLALDDFGTGFSCLSHLQGLPFDVLKIDRSFVHSMTRTRESRKIVAAIAGLAQSLCLDAVAEGIETEEQAEILLRLGCKLGQGWLYGRPLAADRIPEMIAADPISVRATATQVGDSSCIPELESLPTLQLAQLQAIYDGAPVGLSFLDQKLRYVSINQRLATMNGNSVGEHIGRSMQEMYPEWFACYEPYLRRALNGEAITGVEIIKPGSKAMDWPMRTLVSYQPVRDEAEEVIGVSVSVVNLSTFGDFTHGESMLSPLSIEGFQSTWRRTSFAEN
jgi:EAL domain-containing protein (putative c-di-GMP-specific phosphodiesterase class I)